MCTSCRGSSDPYVGRVAALCHEAVAGVCVVHLHYKVLALPTQVVSSTSVLIAKQNIRIQHFLILAPL